MRCIVVSRNGSLLPASFAGSCPRFVIAGRIKVSILDLPLRNLVAIASSGIKVTDAKPFIVDLRLNDPVEQQSTVLSASYFPNSKENQSNNIAVSSLPIASELASSSQWTLLDT